MIKNKTAGKASVAVLAAAMALGMGLPTASFAQGGNDPELAANKGYITVSKVSGQPSTVTYSMVQIFTADVSDAGQASSIAWANNDVRDAVRGAIQTHAGNWTAEDQTADPTHIAGQPKMPAADISAQEAAEYIIANITGTDSTSVLPYSSFGDSLARAIAASSATKVDLTAGTQAQADEGYVLVYSKSPTTGTVSGTSPIFAVINHAVSVSINEKTSVPTVSKGVKESGDSTYTASVDTEIGEVSDYMVTGTLPSNYAEFATYSYTLTDTMTNIGLVTAGNSFAESDVTVKYGASFEAGTAVSAENFVASYESGVLTVAFDDLKTAIPAATKDTKIFVAYQGKLLDTASMGASGSGNSNSATIEYSRDPLASGTGETVPAETDVYTYELDISKVDSNDTNTKIAGVSFTIGATVKPDGALPAAAGSYVVCPANDPAATTTVTTDSNGSIVIKGLDAGSYTIQESAVPDEYELDSTTYTVQITSALKNDGTYDSQNDSEGDPGTGEGAYTATFRGAISGGTNTANRSITSVDAATGTVGAQIRNTLKQNALPATGQAGIILSVAGGIILIAAGVIVGIRRTRSNKEEEE